MTPPKVITDPIAMRQWVLDQRLAGRSVGLVPTMGALHDGHLSLVQAAKRDCDLAVTTLFVNPTQFGPGEDFERYPRDLAGDQLLLATAGCDALFAPSVEAMFPADSQTRIDVGAAARTLEGAIRPTHFQGVATVVMKLFNIAPADRAYFGQKDYQQTVVIRHLVRDLNVPIEVCVCPIVREPDGLAMSSRNAYLSPEERAHALVLYRALRACESAFALGERDPQRLREAMLAEFAGEDGVELDYAELLLDGGMNPATPGDQAMTVVVAARVGRTRLIDNLRLGAASSAAS